MSRVTFPLEKPNMEQPKQKHIYIFDISATLQTPSDLANQKNNHNPTKRPQAQGS